MPKSRNRKNHKEKVAQRNQLIQTKKNKFQKEIRAKLEEEIAKQKSDSNAGGQVENLVEDNNDVHAASFENIPETNS